MKTERDFAKILSTINESGYRGLQIEYDLLPRSLKRDPNRVSSLIKDANLEVAAVAVSVDPYNLHFTHEIDGKIGTLCLFETTFKGAISQTRRLLKLCGKLELSLAVHPHVRSNIETIQEVDALLKSFNDPNLSLVFDSAHFTALSWDLTNFLLRFHEKVSVVHLKDLKRLMPPNDVDYNRDFVDIGDGIIDFERLIKGFNSVGYNGWLIMEVDHPQAGNPSISVRKNYERLSKLV